MISLAYAKVPVISLDGTSFDLLVNFFGSLTLPEEVISTRIKRRHVVSSGGAVYGQSLHLSIH
jgi:hypothetical protein